MEELLTIGYTKKSLSDFIGRLKDAGVDAVVDIRLQNTSQLAGFSKRDDLEFLLRQGFGIDYAHLVELSPSEEILHSYKADQDWPAYEAAYSELIREREMVKALIEAADANGWRRPCLLCAEDKSDMCHRRLLAEATARSLPCLEVRHL